MDKRRRSEILDILDPTPEEPDSIQKMAFWRAAPSRGTSEVLDVLDPTPEEPASIQRMSFWRAGKA